MSSDFFWWIIVPLAAFFGAGAVLGAPYLPIRKGDRGQLLDESGLKIGQTLIDLGSGDGAFLYAAAKRGIGGIGYEINPLLCLISYIRCWNYRHLVSIRWANFWTGKLPPTDAVYVFLIERYMGKLANKLQSELSKPTVVISYIFELPGLKPTQVTRNAFIYKLPVVTKRESRRSGIGAEQK